VHLVDFIIRIYHDARSPERQIQQMHSCIFAGQTADTSNLRNQIMLGFGRRNPRHCAAVRGQITQLPVNRSLALSNREWRPQPASCPAAARQWGV